MLLLVLPFHTMPKTMRLCYYKLFVVSYFKLLCAFQDVAQLVRLMSFQPFICTHQHFQFQTFVPLHISITTLTIILVLAHLPLCTLLCTLCSKLLSCWVVNENQFQPLFGSFIFLCVKLGVMTPNWANMGFWCYVYPISLILLIYFGWSIPIQ